MQIHQPSSEMLQQCQITIQISKSSFSVSVRRILLQTVNKQFTDHILNSSDLDLATQITVQGPRVLASPGNSLEVQGIKPLPRALELQPAFA